MTDKLQKIREEVEKQKSQLIKGACASQIAMETRCKEEAYDEVISLLGSLQEEPVSEELEDASTKSANKATPYTRVDVGNGEVYVYTKHIVIDRFKAGAKWQKEQMMKDAIIATIESDLDPHGADYGNQKIICEL